jgi:hypothetical protein
VAWRDDAEPARPGAVIDTVRGARRPAREGRSPIEAVS